MYHLPFMLALNFSQHSHFLIFILFSNLKYSFQLSPKEAVVLIALMIPPLRQCVLVVVVVVVVVAAAAAVQGLVA
jgi:hypothetical protein